MWLDIVPVTAIERELGQQHVEPPAGAADAGLAPLVGDGERLVRKTAQMQRV
jgi:hypothetical protein